MDANTNQSPPFPPQAADTQPTPVVRIRRRKMVRRAKQAKVVEIPPAPARKVPPPPPVKRTRETTRNVYLAMMAAIIDGRLPVDGTARDKALARAAGIQETTARTYLSTLRSLGFLQPIVPAGACPTCGHVHSGPTPLRASQLGINYYKDASSV